MSDITTDLETMPAVEPYPVTVEPGVYFGMDEDAYHAAFAFSTSGIKHMLISTLDFWVRSPLNADYRSEQSDAMAEGNAWHKRILEGPEAFYAAYAADVDPADHPDALRTVDELKIELKGRHLLIKGNKPELIQRLLLCPDAPPVWDAIKAEHMAANAGKMLISAELARRIEYQAAMIERHPDISRCFQGGYPEVSVFWTDEETGVPMKCRFDYWKLLALVDLKTMGNPLGKSIERCIYGAIATQRYHIQTAVYWQGQDAAIRHIQAGRVFGDVDRAWLRQMATADQNQRQFVFVFQATGIAPVARAVVLPRLNVFDIGTMTAQAAMAEFANCWRTFGRDPWIDMTGIQTLDDAGFPAWIGEG